MLITLLCFIIALSLAVTCGLAVLDNIMLRPSMKEKSFFDEHAIVLGEITVPQGYIPTVDKNLLTYFGNKNREILVGDIRIDGIGCYLNIDGIEIKCAKVRNKRLEWKSKYSTQKMREQVEKILFACENILSLKLWEITERGFGISEGYELENYQGIKILKQK